MLRQRRIVQFFAESINIKQIYVADNLTLLDNITVANSSANIIVAKIYLVRKNFPVVEKGFEDTLVNGDNSRDMDCYCKPASEFYPDFDVFDLNNLK